MSSTQRTIPRARRSRSTNVPVAEAEPLAIAVSQQVPSNEPIMIPGRGVVEPEVVPTVENGEERTVFMVPTDRRESRTVSWDYIRQTARPEPFALLFDDEAESTRNRPRPYPWEEQPLPVFAPEFDKPSTWFGGRPPSPPPPPPTV